MEKEPLLQTPVKRAAKWDAATWDAALRVGCLLLLVVQNSSIILVTSYSRTLQPPYLPTVAVFLAEARRQPNNYYRASLGTVVRCTAALTMPPHPCAGAKGGGGVRSAGLGAAVSGSGSAADAGDGA